MEPTIHTITLDLQHPRDPGALTVKKGDTHRLLRLRLLSGGRPYAITQDCYAVFTAQKPDGTVLYNSCTREGNTLIYQLTPQTTAVAGTLDCEVKLYGAEDSLLTSAAFTLTVEDTVYTQGDDVITSTGEATALTQLISQATAEIADAKAAAQAASTAAADVGAAGYRAESAAQAAQAIAQELEQAKNDGLFNGPQGPQGPKGEKGDAEGAVLYTVQTLSEAQKAQARKNLGLEATANAAPTKVTLTVTKGQLLDLRIIYRLENHGGVTFVDWGDGSANAVLGVTDDEMKHSYAAAGTYTVTITGLQDIPLVFKEKNVSALEIGSTVQRIRAYAFYENPDLTEVTIHATQPPQIYDGGTGRYTPFELPTVKVIGVPGRSLFAYAKASHWGDTYVHVLNACDETLTHVFGDKVVTVGQDGDFATINDALSYLSMYYPLYKAKGIKCEIQILDGTIINEQIWVERLDLSYITITSAAADNTVQVDVTGWTGITHDTRGNKPFISGENGARLPCIKCLFSCIVPAGGWVTSGSSEAINCAVGYFCNRGSTGVVAGTVDANDVRENVGFENFYDNIIANNNSEIVVREAIVRNAGRYGVLSRHISRVSARSADITNCADIAAYADRASMMDVRHADLSGSKNGVAAYHASTITANETEANNIEVLLADARYGAVINCQAIACNTAGKAFVVQGGATIVATDAVITNITNGAYSQAANTLTPNGVIYA